MQLNNGISPYNSLLLGDMGLTVQSLPPTGGPLNQNVGLPQNHPGISLMNYLKGNIIPRKKEGAWFDREMGDEGVYAEPNYNMLRGEIPGPIKGIGKPTITKAKELMGNHGSWSDFKGKLMDYLGIPRDQATKWDVPKEWMYAYRRGTGWNHNDTVQQLGLPKDFKITRHATD